MFVDVFEQIIFADFNDDIPVYPGTIFSISLCSPRLCVRVRSISTFASLALSSSDCPGLMLPSTKRPEVATFESFNKLDVVLPKVSPIWYLNCGQNPPYLKTEN